MKRALTFASAPLAGDHARNEAGWSANRRGERRTAELTDRSARSLNENQRNKAIAVPTTLLWVVTVGAKSTLAPDSVVSRRSSSLLSAWVRFAQEGGFAGPFGEQTK
jgi:hypothetical protein